MGKRFTYHATRIHDRVFFSYDDQGIRRHVEHQLPSQPVGDPQERTHFRNMSRKDRYKAIGNMMQPLLRPLGDHRSIKLPYKYLARAAGVPVNVLVRARPGKLVEQRKSKPDLRKEVLSSMPEFQQEFLNAHAELGLPHRVSLMNHSRPGSPPWTKYYLRLAYQRLGIKHKVVRIDRTSRRPD
jgi:hypothetical protein